MVSVADVDRETQKGQPGGRVWIGDYRSERVAKAQATRWLNRNRSDSRAPFHVTIKHEQHGLHFRSYWRLFISWGAVAEADKEGT